MKKYLLMFVLIMIISACSDKSNPADNNNNNNNTPQISAINPASGYIGSMIQITGKYLGNVQGTSLVTFNTTNLASTDYISWSDSIINVKVPAGASTGKVFITINGKNTNSLDFTVLQIDSNSAPKISKLGTLIAQVGTPIAITGSNFGVSQGNNYITFNGTKATVYSMWTSDKIIATVPEDASTGPVIAYVNNVPSNSIQFTVQSTNYIVTMVTIPAGTFFMGNDNGDIDVKPKHQVTISKSFLMGKSEVTQKQWMVVMDNSNPSHPYNLGDNKPVQQVTFKRAADFCNRLSVLEKFNPCYTIIGDDVTCDFTKNGYRLPTEAEWEYACKAGKSTDYTDEEIPEYSWCSSNADGFIHEVMNKKPNAFGLYDMLGNVDEWCWDMYDEQYYSVSPAIDPPGPTTEVNDRVIRGGSYQNGADHCKAILRNSFPGGNDNYNYNLGFRIVRVK